MMPSPSDLTYFVEAANTSNLSRAAERLGISQPSLSMAIQRLEYSIGAPLLVRSKKGVTLTQSGKQLLSHSRRLIQSWESVKGHALASAKNVQGCFTLGCHVSVALYTVSKFLPKLLEDYPLLEVKLHHDLSRKITESVVQMRTDIGIAVNPVRHPDLVIRKLFHDDVTFWVGRGERKVQDFRSGEAVLICDPDLLQSQELMKKLFKGGVRYRRVLTSSSLEVITRLVADGAGIGILPSRVAAQLNLSQFTKVPKAPSVRDEICLLYRVENRDIRTIQVIAESVIQAC